MHARSQLGHHQSKSNKQVLVEEESIPHLCLRLHPCMFALVCWLCCLADSPPCMHA
jgi:hypothetical protein